MITTIKWLVAAVALLLVMPIATSQESTPSNFYLGLNAGYNRGAGFQLSLTTTNPIESLPIGARVAVGYTSLDPGSSADARRIFINNATNGVPEEKARAIDYRLDVLVPTGLPGLEKTFLHFGPRYSSFRANFKYVGGNEDFDVTSRQFGLGAGADTHFKINNRLDLVVLVGLDYYFDNTLKGHDTSYSPDDDNVNPRNDNQNNDAEFTYSDADEAIKQPEIMPRVFLGINYKL